MKYVKILMLAAAMMTAISCIKENAPENKPETNENLVEMTFTATSDDSQTKAAFDEDTYPAIVWEGNESIAVLAMNTDQKFDTESTGKVAEFSGLANITDDEFFAVYPYDEAITLEEGILKNVTIPSVQTATAGSFDPNAFVAVAKSDDKNNFTFKAIGGFLKFKVGDEDVKSVTVTANAYVVDEEQKDAPTIAGTAGVSWGNDMPSHGASGTWTENKSTSIKLVEGAQAYTTETNYFIAMLADSCPGGITVYVEYDNGDVYSISSTEKLFTDGSQNMIKNLGTFTKSKMTKVNDLYVLYNLGYDINVGSKTYNKVSHTFELLTAAKENDPAIRAKVHQKDGQFYLFVDSGEYNFELGSYATTQSEVVVIGRYHNNPAKVSYTQISRINSGSLAMKNLAIKTTYADKYIIENTESTGDVSYMIFDNCKILDLNKPFIYIGKTNKINDIQFKDCDVKISGDNAVLVKSYVGNTYPSITYSNNIIYNNGDLNTNFKLFCDDKTKSSTVTDVIVNGNTFVNTYASTTYLIYTNTCSKIAITNNLIYYPTAISNGTGYLRTTSEAYPEDANRTISNNIAFCTDGTKAIRYLYVNKILGANNTNTVTDGTNPFSTYDLAKGVFVQSPTYVSYGARR